MATAKIEDFMVVDNVVYSAVSSVNFGVIQWSDSALNDISIQPIYKETFGSDPAARGWIVGSDWVYDDTNHNMKSPNV